MTDTEGYGARPLSSPSQGAPLKPRPGFTRSPWGVASQIALPLLGLVLLRMQLRYQSFALTLFPRGESIPAPAGAGAGLPSWAPFLVALIVLTAIGLARWRSVSSLLTRRRGLALALTLAGSCGASLVNLAGRGLLPEGAAAAAYIAGSAAVAAGLCVCTTMWYGYLATRFSPLKIVVLFASYPITALACAMLRGVSASAAAAITSLLTFGSGAAWFFSRQPGGGAQVVDPYLNNDFKWFDLTDLLTVLLVFFQLNGSIMRGIIDIADSPDPRLRSAISFALSVALLACGAVYAVLRARQGARETRVGAQASFERFGLLVWAGGATVMLVGMLMYMSRTHLLTGAYLSVCSHTMLGGLLAAVTCELCSRRSVSFAPVALLYGVGFWTLCWAVSYMAVPALVEPSHLAQMPPKGSTRLVLLTAVGIVALTFAALALSMSRRAAGKAPTGPVAQSLFPPAGAGGPTVAGEEGAADEGGRLEAGAGPAGPDEAGLLMGRYMLTYREAQVAVLFSRGYSLGRVAEEAGVAKSTAQGYIKNAYRKLGVHSRNELIDRLAREAGGRERG